MIDIKKEIGRPLSEDEIKSALNKIKEKAKIISYLDLEKYPSIDSLFGSYKYIVLLYTADESKVGHWVLLIRHAKDRIELFDSYAYRPDNLLKFFKKNGKEMFPLLSSLLYRSNVKKLEFNTTRLQRLRNDVGVCGRWVILRILFDACGYSLADFLKIVKKNKAFKKGTYDGWSVLMTQGLV